MAFFTAMLFVEPFPDPYKYVHSERQRRQTIYYWCAKLYSILIPFSTVSAVSHYVLFALGEMPWPGKEDLQELWFHVGIAVLVFAWLHFLLCTSKQWMYSPSRFILRRGLRFFEIEVGQSGVHLMLWLYLGWVTMCRMLSGRWAYNVLNQVQKDATSAMALMQYAAAVVSLHGLGLIAWRLSLAVAPAINTK
jgi:hypothetical protein